MALTAALDPVRHGAIGGSNAGAGVRLGLFLSIALHAAILIWAAISIGTARAPVTPDEVPVEISLLTTADFANMRKGSETSKEKTTAAKPKEADPTDAPPVKAKHVATPPPAADPVPPEPKPDPAPVKPADPIADKIAKAEPLPAPAKADPVPPEPKPDPAPVKQPDPIAAVLAKPDPALDATAKAAEDEQKRKTAEAEAKKQQELAKKAAEEKARKEEERRVKKAAAEAKKKEKRLASLDKLQAQINNLPDAAPDAGSDQAPDPTAKTAAPAVGVKHPSGTQLSATEQQIYLATFSRKVQGCWSVLAGAADGRDLVVPVSFDLNPDGSLKSDPVVTGGGASPSFALAAENVVRAIKQCGPYPLPPADYAKWQHWDIDFDPRAMFGG